MDRQKNGMDKDAQGSVNFRDNTFFCGDIAFILPFSQILFDEKYRMGKIFHSPAV